MNERRFVAERAERWRELGTLIDRAHRYGLGRLPGADVRRLGALYRSASTDLAAARTLGCSEDTVRHVNRLCAAAHDLVYAGRRRGPAGALAALLLDEFPRLARRTLGWHLASAAILLVGGLAAYAVFREDPDLADGLFGPVFRSRAEAAAAQPEGARRFLDLRLSFAPFFSWGIIANNLQASLILFAVSAGTVLLGVLALLFNGVMVGAGYAVFADVGVPDVFVVWCAAHGPLELSALCLASGAGLRMGVAWLLPGRRSRLAAFQDAGRDALVVLAATSLMLVVAGLLEGFVSPSDLPAGAKVAIGAAAWLGLAGWTAGGGRREPAAARRA